MIWLVPGAVLVVGAVVVAMAVSRAVEEAKRLVWEVRVLSTQRPALVEVGEAAQRLGVSLRAATVRNRGRT